MRNFRTELLGTIVDAGGRHDRLVARVLARETELRALGCQEGDCALLVQGNEAGFFVNLLALWRIGSCVAPLSPQSAPAEIARAAEHSGCRWILRDGAFLRTEPTRAAPVPGTALLLYTSGTTSAPKGVMLSFAALAAKLAALKDHLPPEVLARTLCLLPVSFGHGLVGNCLPALLGGHELHLREAGSHGMLGSLCDELGITFFSSVPSAWAAVLAFAAPPERKTLRRVFCASATLSVAAHAEARRWLGGSVDFRNVYGLTEAASWISALPEGAPYEREGLVGPGWGCEWALSAEGEVLVKAPYLMTGYHGEDGSAIERGYLRTGDLGTIENGSLRLLGRIKQQINRGGLKVSPAEVEEALRTLLGVADAHVFALPDDVAGEIVAAAVVAAEGITAQQLRERCRLALSEFKIPQKVFFVAEIPRNARGKVDGAALRRLAGDSKIG